MGGGRDGINQVIIPIWCRWTVDNGLIGMFLFYKFFNECLLQQLDCDLGLVVGIIYFNAKEVVEFSFEGDLCDMQ